MRIHCPQFFELEIAREPAGLFHSEYWVAALVYKFACCGIEIDLYSGKSGRSLVVPLESAESNSDQALDLDSNPLHDACIALPNTVTGSRHIDRCPS